MQRRKRLVAFSFAALVVAGCSNDEASAPSTAPVSVAASVADTTVVTTTVAPTSTSTTTIAPTTLPATTTTVATEDLIKQAVQDYFEAYEQCGAIPAACVPSDFTATQGPSRAVVTDFASAMVAEGLYFSADVRGTYLVAESVSMELPTEATAIYCAHDALIVLGPTGPDGLPTTVNDTIASVRYTYGLFLEDGSWLVGRQHESERLGTGNLCPPFE